MFLGLYGDSWGWSDKIDMSPLDRYSWIFTKVEDICWVHWVLKHIFFFHRRIFSVVIGRFLRPTSIKQAEMIPRVFQYVATIECKLNECLKYWIRSLPAAKEVSVCSPDRSNWCFSTLRFIIKERYQPIVWRLCAISCGNTSCKQRTCFQWYIPPWKNLQRKQNLWYVILQLPKLNLSFGCKPNRAIIRIENIL